MFEIEYAAFELTDQTAVSMMGWGLTLVAGLAGWSTLFVWAF